VRTYELLHTRFDTMTHYESAIDQIAERLQGVDASLTSSIADILVAAQDRTWSDASRRGRHSVRHGAVTDHLPRHHEVDTRGSGGARE
jgi:DNA-binding ferritin-like protein